MWQEGFRVSVVSLTLILTFSGAPVGFGQETASTEIAGGRGGSPFADSEKPNGGEITEVHIFSGDHIDAVQMVYILPDGRILRGPRHGGSGGRQNIFRLDSDEYIVGLSGRCGDFIDSIRLQTNKRTSPVYGGSGGNREFRIDVPSGNQAVGFIGRAGSYVDAIGLITAPRYILYVDQTPIAGGRGGAVFSDRDIPIGARISEVRVRAGDIIDAIQAMYILPNGQQLEGSWHGGRGGRIAYFRLEPDEYIIGLSGRYGDHIDSLQIHTNRRNSQLFGGRGGDRSYRLDVPTGNQTVGFIGRSGSYLDAIGLNYAKIESSKRRSPRRGRFGPFN